MITFAPEDVDVTLKKYQPNQYLHEFANSLKYWYYNCGRGPNGRSDWDWKQWGQGLARLSDSRWD